MENINHKRLIQYIIVLVSVLVMSWEQAYSQPLLWQSQQLPEDAIRLRVLPNSDRPVDQWLKHRVRDVVTEHMQEWTSDLTSSEQAQAYIAGQLEVTKQLVQKTLQQEGFSYPVNISFGEADFPTIKYGEHLYPEGTYQALIIEIGNAQGQNWWCVLYPPLCFVDIVSAQVIDKDALDDLTADELAEFLQLKEKDTYIGNEQKVKVVKFKFFLAKLFNK